MVRRSLFSIQHLPHEVLHALIGGTIEIPATDISCPFIERKDSFWHVKSLPHNDPESSFKFKHYFPHELVETDH